MPLKQVAGNQWRSERANYSENSKNQKKNSIIFFKV